MWVCASMRVFSATCVLCLACFGEFRLLTTAESLALRLAGVDEGAEGKVFAGDGGVLQDVRAGAAHAVCAALGLNPVQTEGQ